MKTCKELGLIIKKQRLNLNLTMDNVAHDNNITRATLSSIENGKSNASINTFLKLFDYLGLEMKINFISTMLNKKRASRLNSVLDKKINKFIVMCVEQYASAIKKPSSEIYFVLKSKGIIDNLKDDYEDLHGMSKEYINQYINSIVGGIIK